MTQPTLCPYGGGHTIAWTGSTTDGPPVGFYSCSRCHGVVVLYLSKAFLEEVTLGLLDAADGRWVEDADLEAFTKP